jgi:hypothetical protein
VRKADRNAIRLRLISMREGTPQEGKELLLIGTVHGDPDGMLRLLGLLKKEEPGLVAVEVSPYGLSYRQRRGRRLERVLRRRLRRVAKRHGLLWEQWGQFQAVVAQLSFPFEYRASLRFCRDSGAVLSCLDLSAMSRELIQTSWDELVSSRNIKALLHEPPEPPHASVKKAYAMASKLLRERQESYLSAFFREWQTDPGWKIREAALAEGIGKRYKTLKSGQLAYVGGWQHLLYPTDTGTLCDRLSHLHPRRILLADPFAGSD